jgi:DNA-binding NtrC family response regulator
MAERAAVQPVADRRVWIVEDEPAAAALAVELCQASGAVASVFRAPLPFLSALRAGNPPAAVVLDWRLEDQLSAALFLATRHQHPTLAVVYWTGSAAGGLPSMIRDDAFTRVVNKAAGARAFEEAVAWALADAPGDAEEGEARPG